jgi:hypothetical protein
VGLRLATVFLLIFFTASLYHELTRVYANERPLLRRGLRFAASRIAPICCWSVVMASVGLVLHLCNEHLGRGPQQIYLMVAGVAIWVAEMFAIPVLLRGGILNPIAVLRQSWVAGRQTWIELTGLFLGLTGIQFILAVFIHIFPVLVPGPETNRILGSIAGCLFLTALYLATSIHLCALYIYATEGVAPRPVQPEDLDASWEINSR